MSIQLTPKVDTDFNTRVGWTGSSRPTGSTKSYFNSWNLGQAPGAGIDIKTWKNGAVTYYVSGKDLLNPKIKIDCDNARTNIHALTQDFGIQDWLKRLIESSNQAALGGTVTFDKPTFGAEITVRMDGTGAYTYNFPYGTTFASMGGWYEIDEILTISFTPDPKTPLVQFPPLPSSAFIGQKPIAFSLRKRGPGVAPGAPIAPRARRSAVPQGVSPDAKARLDQLQNEQAVRNLQFRN